MPTFTVSATGGNWSSGTTWVGGVVPNPSGDDIIVPSGAGNLTVDVNRACLTITFQAGYNNTFTISNGITLTVAGTGATVTLVSGMTYNSATTGELSTIGNPGGSCTVNFNGVIIPRLRIGTNNTGVFCTTVIGTGTTPTVQNLSAVPFTGGNSAITNGTLTVTNSIFVNSGGVSGGSTTTGSLLISGNCSINTVGTAFLNIPLTILNGSTLTITSPTFTYGTVLGGGATLTFNSGSTLNIGTSLLNIIGQSAILNTSNVTWYDVQVNGAAFQATTLTSNLNISRNLSIVANTHGFTSSGGSFNVIVGGGLSIGTGITFILNNTNVILTGTNPGTNIIDGGTIQGNGVAASKISITGSNYQIGTASKLTLGVLSVTFELSPTTPTAAATVVSGHTLAIGSSFTLTTNNTATGANIGGTEIIWNNITQSVNTTTTITYDTTTTGNLANISTGTAIFNGGKISFGGNLSTTGTGISGTSTLEFSGPNNATWGAGTYVNNVTINKSSAATVTTTGTVIWGTAGRTLNIITGNNLVLSNILRVNGGTFIAVGIVTGSANLELAGTCTLDVATGVTIPNLRANSVAAITVTLSRTTVVTNFSKTGQAGVSDITFSASTAGTELQITNYTAHTFNLGATLMGTNTTLRFMGPSCTFDSFNIGGNVVLDTGATLTPLATSTLLTSITFAANTTLNFSGGTLVLPAITNSNKLGTGFAFTGGTAHTINMGSNSIDWVVCNNGPTVTLQANLVINKAINQGINSITFTGPFNVIVRESLGTAQFFNYYQILVSGGCKIVYQSSPTGFIGTGYISGTNLFITSVIQGTLGNSSIIHVPSSTTTSYTQISNCTTFPTAGTGQYTVLTSMTVGSVGSPVTIYGFGIGVLGINGLLEIDAGSNEVYLSGAVAIGSTGELRYLSTNTGIFDGSKAIVIANSAVGGIIDFQNQSSPSKLINTFSPGFNFFGNLVLKSDLYVNDFNCGNGSGLTQTGGPWSLYVLRNATIANDSSVVARTITPIVRFEGPLNGNLTFGSVCANLVVNKSSTATLTVVQNFNYGYVTPTTFTYTAGLVNFGATTMTVIGNCTIISPSSVGNFSFNSVTINAGITLTLQNTMRILGTLLCNGNATFQGTHGWTTNTFTCLTTGSIITLQNSSASPNAIYYISTALNLTGASSTSRILLQASGSATFNARAGSPSTNSLQYVSGTIPSVGMTVSQTTGQSPVGFSNLLPTRPVINGGTSPNFTLDQTIVPSIPNPPTGTISMRAGYKAIFTLQSGAFQNVAYVTTQDIDSLSNSGATILSFGSNNDDVATDVFLYRTLNWGPLLPSSGSAYRTWVD